jgi:hypothetical protein
MNKITLILNIIPIFFILYCIFCELMRVIRSRGEKLVILYGGGFFVRPLLNFFCLLYLLLVVMFMIVNFSKYPDVEMELYFIYGISIPIAVIYYSLSISIYIGEEAIYIGNKRLVWHEREEIYSILSRTNDNKKFPYILNLVLNSKKINVLVPEHSVYIYQQVLKEVVEGDRKPRE